MNWIKSPLTWQVWSSSTLLASLSIHGLILTLPLAPGKDVPKPETLTAVPITAIPTQVPAISSPQQPEPEPTVQPPPQRPEPSMAESEPLFERIPSRSWSSFSHRSHSFAKPVEEPEEPVEDIEPQEEVETPDAPVEELRDLEETAEPPQTSGSDDGETSVEPDNDERTVPETTSEAQPSIDPRKKIRLTSTPPTAPSGDSGEGEQIERTFLQGNENVENLFSSLEKNEKGTLSNGEKEITELLQAFELLPDISNIKSLFFDRETLTQLKPEIDKEQSLFILSSTESPVDLNKLRQYYINPLESQGFKVKQELTPSQGEIYRVEKTGMEFVRYIQLYETDLLEGQLLTGVIVWKQLPGQ